VVGSRTKIKVVKNKTAAPFREAEFDIMYGEGISKLGDMLDLGVVHNIVEKSGAWFSYNGERIGQGRENAKLYLKENKDIAAKLDAQVRKAVGLKEHPGAGHTNGSEAAAHATTAHGKEGPAHSKSEPPIKLAARK